MSEEPSAKAEVQAQQAKLAEQRQEIRSLNDLLAHERTLLAKERTFAAWMRTGLAAMAGGFVVAKVAEDGHPAGLAEAAGIVLVVTGAAVQMAGYWEYRQVASQMKAEGQHGMPGWLILVLSIGVLFAAGAMVILLLL